MCEANAYLIAGRDERMLMESVDKVKREGQNVWSLTNLFGERLTVRGLLLEMDLGTHRILFEETAETVAEHAHEHTHRHEHPHEHEGVRHTHEHNHAHAHDHRHEGSEQTEPSHAHDHPGHEKEPHVHEH